MNNPSTLQKYINNFRRHLAPYLRPGVGLACNVFPAEATGAILEFTIGSDIANGDVFQPAAKTVNQALSELRQNAFGGNLDGFRFSGTNVIMEDKRIILIKGDDYAEFWNDNAAAEDVKKLLPPQQGGRR
jgi:hypothetical protein